MDIPKSLESTWKQVAQDGKITKADYEKLVSAATPTGKEEELDETETNFLLSLKSDLEKNGGEKGSIPVSGISFKETSTSGSAQPKISIKDFGEVPETLKGTWNRAIEDGKISSDEYKFLLDVASPTWSDEELDDKEQQFLSNLKSLLTQSNNLLEIAPEPKAVKVAENKATVEKPVKTLAAVSGESEQALEQLNQVKSILDSLDDDPDFAPLKNIVSSRIQNNQLGKQYSTNVNAIMTGIESGKSESLTVAKGKLDAEYGKLPENLKNNPQIKQLHDDTMNYVDITLNQLKVKNTPKNNKPQKNNSQNSTNTSKNKGLAKTQQDNSAIPSTLRKAWATAIKDGNLTQSDFENLMKAAAPNKKNAEFDDKELEFLAGVRDNLDAHNGIISFVDNPDESVGTKPITPANSGFGAIPDSLQSVWNEVTKDGTLNTDGFDKLIKAAAPTDKMEELDEAEQVFLAAIKEKFINADGSAKDSIQIGSGSDNQVTQNSALSDLGEVPPSLKPAWDKVLAKGELTNSDYNKLIVAAAPNGDDAELDDNEHAFLSNLRQKLTDNNGSLDLRANTSGNKGNQPVLLNWPGYTKETKDALRNAFGGQIVGTNMPVLPTKLGKEIAATFGVTNIMDLQRLVNAKVDGKFGPETFFKAKVYIASQMNKENTDINKLNGMLNALGKNDKEVTSMKESLSSGNTGSSTSGTAKASNTDGVPSSLKTTWNEVTKDGKLTTDDFEKLITAAAPNKKNSEFDNAELEFIASIKEQLEQNNGELTVNVKPDESTNTSGTAKASNTDGIPSSLKATWNQVTKDGKLTTDDFEKLITAAAPNKKNSEFDNAELEFIASIKEQLAQNNGVLAVNNKPEPNNNVKTDSKANIDLGGINQNDQAAVANLQKKINLLIKTFETSQQKNLTKVPTDGKINQEFVNSLNAFQGAIGQPAVKAVLETEAGLKQELGVAQLDSRSAKFVVFQDNDFKILGNVKDLTRIETAKNLLTKMGINIGSYKIEYPENPAKNGDLKLVGNGLNLAVFDNIQAGRNSNSSGDFRVQGTANGKTVDVSYWENQRRGADEVKKNGLFNLKTIINGVPNQQKNNEGFLPRPLYILKS